MNNFDNRDQLQSQAQRLTHAIMRQDLTQAPERPSNLNRAQITNGRHIHEIPFV